MNAGRSPRAARTPDPSALGEIAIVFPAGELPGGRASETSGDAASTST
jgi:hypothetical protein